MKWLIRICIPLVVLGGCVFGDIKFASWLFAHLPATDWVFWAKLGIGIGIFWLTAGVVIGITALSGLLVMVITEE